MQTLEQDLRALIGRHAEAVVRREIISIASSMREGEQSTAGATVELLPDERFIVNAGMVTDQRTGLTWSQENVPGGERKWAEAQKACIEFELGGFSDWRLPSIRELLTIVDYERHEPAIDIAFKCDSAWYWTSTPYHGSPGVVAWVVSFGSGNASWLNQDYGYLVRAVRSSQSFDLWHVR